MRGSRISITARWKERAARKAGRGEVESGGRHAHRGSNQRPPLGIVEIELKKAWFRQNRVLPLDPLKVDPKALQAGSLKNDQVRVFRVKIGPHEVTPLPRHTYSTRVLTYITDQTFRVTAADGKVDMPVHKAGDVSWGVPAKHTEENLSDKPFEVVVTEFK